jgi:hypothetical protein
MLEPFDPLPATNSSWFFKFRIAGHDIAQCFKVTNYAAETIIGTLGASLGGHAAADIALSFVPGVGTGIKVATAGSVTMTLGTALIEYFQDRSPLRC